MKRGPLIGACLVLLAAGFLTFKIKVSPSPDTRMILEHTYRTYISPPCYEQAKKTNNLAEADIQTAIQVNYQPESSCTENSLAPIHQPIAYVLAEKLGMKKSQWDW